MGGFIQRWFFSLCKMSSKEAHSSTRMVNGMKKDSYIVKVRHMNNVKYDKWMTNKSDFQKYPKKTFIKQVWIWKKRKILTQMDFN